jgi:hypothetical protein
MCGEGTNLTNYQISGHDVSLGLAVTLKPHTHNQTRALYRNRTAVAYYISTSVDGKGRTPSLGEGRPGTRHCGTGQRQQGQKTCRVVRGVCEVTIVELVGRSECHYPSRQHMSNRIQRPRSFCRRSLKALPKEHKPPSSVRDTRRTGCGQ